MEKQCIAIMQPGYFPWLGFFELMNNSNTFVFLDDVQYTKRDWRNRNRIRTHTGWQWITVPVYSKSKQEQLIQDVRINNGSEWAKKHCNALKVNYHKAKFFQDYFPKIETILLKNWLNLRDLCCESIAFLRNEIGISTPCINYHIFLNLVI